VRYYQRSQVQCDHGTMEERLKTQRNNRTWRGGIAHAMVGKLTSRSFSRISSDYHLPLTFYWQSASSRVLVSITECPNG
jgi:hypothetical protein